MTAHGFDVAITLSEPAAPWFGDRPSVIPCTYLSIRPSKGQEKEALFWAYHRDSDDSQNPGFFFSFPILPCIVPPSRSLSVVEPGFVSINGAVVLLAVGKE
jgi:hypothetical protein